MSISTERAGEIKGMLASLLIAILIVSPSVISAQDISQQKPEKPQLETLNQGERSGNSGAALMNSSLLEVPLSHSNTGPQGYWSHLTTSNTGDLPWGETFGYAFPRYWNYVFVDSSNRYFVDSGGLFVWNGFNWQPVMVNGEQLFRVREIVEDNGGNLWVGTYNGLYQLSSSLQLINKYTTSNSNLKTNDVNTLWIENDGSLWVGHRGHESTGGGGVTILHEQVIDSLGVYTNDIIQRSNGDVWVAQAPDEQGNGGYIYVYRPSNDSSWAYTESNSGLPHSEVDNFSEDSQGNIWMGHYPTAHHPMGGVTRFDGTNWTLFDQDDGLPQAGAWYTYAASDDKIYYSTGDSMMVYENNSWNHFTNDNDRFPLRGVTIVTEDRDGNLVVGADPGADLVGGGLQIYDGSSWEFISSYTDNGLFSNVVFGADVDAEGNLWVSGFYGAAMFDGSDWTYFNEYDGMGDTYAWKVEVTSDGSVWFGVADEAGVTRYKDGSFTEYDQYGEYVEAIFEDSQGNIWFGAFDWKNIDNPGGILKYDGSNFTVFDETDGIIGVNVTAFGEGPNGNIYAATNAGALVYDGSSWSEFAVDGQTGVGVGELASDANGNLWISSGGAIKKWDGSTWTTFDSSDGFMGWTTHIEPAADGSIWLAGARIQVIRDGNVFDMTPPGYSSTSYVITHDDQGQTWVGTYGGGVYKYEMSEGLAIESIADYPDDQGGWVTLTAGGFLMDPLTIDSGFNGSSWEVQRKNGDKWESAGTSFEFSGESNQISVQVPTTMPTGEDLAEHKYIFRVGVYDSNGDVLGYSEPDTAFALDNVAPSAVTGVQATRGSDQVSLSWNAPNINDLGAYEIIDAETPEGNPLATTTQTSVTLSDTDYEGIQPLLVRARDIHANVGEASSEAIARFPMTLDYQVQEEWNLISLPLDADPADVAALTDAAEEGTLYEYDGSYQPVETLEPGHGYWAKFSSADTYSVPGLPVATQSIELSEGWNLVAGIGATVEASQIQDPNGILIDGTLTDFDGGYTEAEALSPGDGYWIRTSEAGSITLSAAGGTTGESLNKGGSPLAEAKQQLNTITVQSSAGYESTLYFGQKLSSNVNPLSFSLPPQAPGNSVDVRMAGDLGRYSEGESVTVRLQQPNDSEQQLTISLDLVESAQHQRYEIQERAGSTVLATHTVGPDEEITVSPSATTLKVSPAGQSLAADTPDEFALAPSYPNPFNPSTTIQYTLPQQVQVQLEVYNMVGQRVRTLLAGQQQEAGTHAVRFDASALSSGVYFVRLQAGSFQQIQKITLIK